MVDKVGVNISSGNIEKESVVAIQDLIIAILDSNNDQKTKRKALNVLGKNIKVAAPSHITLSNMSIDMTDSTSDGVIEQVEDLPVVLVEGDE